MKTGEQIFDACKAAGVRSGDIVRMKSGQSGLVCDMDDVPLIRLARGCVQLFRDSACFDWPTHYARLTWDEVDVDRRVGRLDGECDCNFVDLDPTTIFFTKQISYEELSLESLDRRLRKLENA